MLLKSILDPGFFSFGQPHTMRGQLGHGVTASQWWDTARRHMRAAGRLVGTGRFEGGTKALTVGFRCVSPQVLIKLSAVDGDQTSDDR